MDDYDVHFVTLVVTLPTRYNSGPAQERGDAIPPQLIEKIKTEILDQIGPFTAQIVEGGWAERDFNGPGGRKLYFDLSLRIFMNVGIKHAAKAWDYLTASACHWAEELDQEAIYLEANGLGANRHYVMRRPGDPRQELHTNPFRRGFLRRPRSLARQLSRRLPSLLRKKQPAEV